MILKDFLPNPVFKEFVQCYRIVHFEFENGAQIPVKAYTPKPEEVIHFFLVDFFAIEKCGLKEYQPSITLVGQRTFITMQHIGHNFLDFQIIFQPTALYRLTGIPSLELTNLCLDAEDIFTKSIRRIHEQLQHAESYNKMLSIADKFVAELIKQEKREVHLIDSVTRLMIRAGGNLSLDWLAKESCLCSKQFKRKFRERVGVNPKTYGKIIRFTKAFNTRNAYPLWNWLRIAVDCGYYDYQHLVKDYKELTGLNPHEFHILENNAPERKLNLVDDLYQTRLKLYSL